MQVNQTQSEGLKRGFTVTVPAGDLEARRAARLAELGRTINLPGFRPGKVPASLVKQRYGAALHGEIVEQLVNDTTSKVLEDGKLRPAAQPKVELVAGGEGEGDLEFKIELEILPDISMPDLSGLELTRLTAKPSDETIDKALAELVKRQRSFEAVEVARPAQSGDVVNCDFVGKLAGTPFDGGTAQDVNVEIGGTGFIPGFAEQLAGMNAGDEKVITVTFPEDYQASELAGKEATFDIKANALKVAVDPVLDDNLAKQIGFETVAQLRDIIVKQAEGEYGQLSRLRIKRELLDILCGKIDFEVPESMVETEFAQIWQRVQQDRASGEVDEEDAGRDEETLRADYRKIAERRVRLGLLLAEIGRAREITVTRDELMQAVRQEATRYPGQEKEVFDFFAKNPQAVDGLRGPILENKVVDYLIELARVTEKEVTPEELAEIPPADL